MNEVTGRVVWAAACRLQRRAREEGVTRPILSIGPERPKWIEYEVDTGRVRVPAPGRVFGYVPEADNG